MFVARLFLHGMPRRPMRRLRMRSTHTPRTASHTRVSLRGRVAVQIDAARSYEPFLPAGLDEMVINDHR